MKLRKKNLHKILIVGNGNSGKRFKKLLKKNHIKSISSKRFDLDVQSVEKKYNLIIICSPASFHVNHLKKLLDYSNKFLIEKPLFSNISDYNYLKKIVNQKEKKIFINYNLRETNFYKYLKNFVHYNKSKKLNYVKFYVGQNINFWKGDDKNHFTYSKQFYGGGALSQLSHEVDLALFLFGHPDKFCLIKKKVDKFVDGVDDISNLSFFYKKKNFLLEINMNMLDNFTQRYVELLYRNFSARFDFIKKKLLIFKKNKKISTQKFDNDLIYSNKKVVEKILKNDFSGLCDLKQSLTYVSYLFSKKSIL